MLFRWPRPGLVTGLTAVGLAGLLARGAAAELPSVTASLEGAEVATGHLFHALLFLPTGLMAGVLLLEFFAQWKKNREVEPAILFLLFGAAGAAVGVAGLAFALSPVGRAAGELENFAIWMALVAGAIGVAFYLKRQARNRRLFSLGPVPALSGRIALPRTSGQRGLLIGYRIAVVVAFLLTLVGVSEMPLRQPSTRSVAEAARQIARAWGQPAPAPKAVAFALDPVADPDPKPQDPVAPVVPPLAALLGSEGQPSAADPATAPAPPMPAVDVEASTALAVTPPPEPPADEPAPATTPPESPAAASTPSAPASPATAAAATPVVGRLPSNFFATKIKPVLDSKCVDCHGASKQKGDLRLDSVAAIKHGAGHPVVVAGDLELSTIYQRLITPDAEDLMPPRDKGGPLSPSVIALFKSWIQAGADFGDGATPLGSAPTAAARPGGKLEEEKSRSLTPPPADVISRLTEAGAVIRPMSANGALLDINMTHFEAGPVNPADLTPIAPNILALDLSRTRLKDESLAALAGMTNLVRLDLKRNPITDAGLVHLKGLVELESLNLFDTQVSDAGIAHLTGLKRLQRIFLFNTKVTSAGADQLRAAIPGIVVNLGE